MMDGMETVLFGEFRRYGEDHGGEIGEAEFARLNAVASGMICALCGRAVYGKAENHEVLMRAAHWQIWYLNTTGAVSGGFAHPPSRESFAGYTVEHRAGEGAPMIGGIALCPMTLQVLSGGGLLGSWI